VTLLDVKTLSVLCMNACDLIQFWRKYWNGVTETQSKPTRNGCCNDSG
jgi:hypothetical protein